MDDVTEVMARQIAAHVLGDPEEEARGWIKDALRAAKKAGWRLVPTKASGKQVNMLIAQELSHAFYERLIDAAPRPWTEPDEVER